MATYSIKVLKEGRTLARKQVTKGVVKTETVVIQAGPDQTYVVSDALAQDKAPTQLQTRRVGQDLHISFGDSSVAAPDVIIENYFSFQVAPILGTLGDGSSVLYDMGQILGLAQSGASGNALDGAGSNGDREASVTLQDPHPYAGFSGLQILGGVGLGALALLGGKSGGGGDAGASSQPTAAQTAQAKISAFAADNTQPVPVAADYAALGVSGVTASNIGSINSSITALPANQINSLEKLQPVVDAYIKILAEANGTTADATPGSNPTAADYAAIGASIGAAAGGIANLSLLNDVLGNKVTSDVDTVAEINTLADAVNAVVSCAAGGGAISVAQLSLLGVTGVNADNLAAVQAGIQATLDSGSEVDSLSKLQTVVNASISQYAIESYAANGTNPAPILTDYTQLGVTGVAAANLAAINSAVDALDSSAVSDAVKIQSVVDAYAKILAEANGTAADATPGINPTANDYAKIGADIGLAKNNSYALSLLDDVVGGLNTTAVDSVSEINGLAAVVDRIMNTAAGGSGGLGVDDFSRIGIATSGAGAVTDVNLTAVVNAIATSGGQSHVSTMPDLQNLVSAVATIVSYSDSNTQAAPTLVTYSNAGLTGVTSANLSAINSAIDANAPSGVDTKSEVQAIIDSYNVILAEANGAAPDATPAVNPSALQYATIGANIGGAATNAQSLSLLNDAVSSVGVSSIDTVAEINALAATVDKIISLASLATGSAIPAGVPTMAELSALGLNTTLANTVAEQNAIWQAIIDSADSGAGVMTILQLQALIDAHAS